MGNPHASVIKLVRQNIKDIEEFGRVGFEIQPFNTPGGKQNREIAILNEPQATLVDSIQDYLEVNIRSDPELDLEDGYDSDRVIPFGAMQ